MQGNASRRLPHGFAARISSQDSGARPTPAAREHPNNGQSFEQYLTERHRVSAGPATDNVPPLLEREEPRHSDLEDRWQAARNGEPGVPAQRPAAEPKFVEPKFVEPKFAPRGVSQPLSSFIIVAPPAGQEQKVNKEPRRFESTYDAAEVDAARRRPTVSAEYNAAPVTNQVAEQRADAPAAETEKIESPRRDWPLSAFTSARWSIQPESARQEKSRFARRKPRMQRDAAVDFAGGVGRLIEQAVRPPQKEPRPPAVPPRRDQSSRTPSRRHISLAARIFQPAQDRSESATRLVALHQSAESQVEVLERLVEPDDSAAAAEVLPSPLAGGIKPISSIDASIAPPAGPLPDDLAAAEFAAAGQVVHAAGTTRHAAASLVLWEAPATSNFGLLFEDPNLERHGHSAGIFQPALSAAHFFGRVPALPYLMAADSFGQCHYTLGHFRPGSCAPYQVYLPPLSLKGLTAEATTALGLLYLIP